MATRTAVSRLADRVDALAARRWQGLTLERIADEAHERMDQLLAEANLQPRSPGYRNGCEHLSDAEIVGRLVELGVLTAADFKK